MVYLRSAGPGYLTEVSVPSAAEVAAKVALRRRDFPGYKNLPTLNTAAATCTSGAPNAASAISSSVLIPSYDRTAFTYFGTVPTFGGSTFPDYFSITGRKQAMVGDVYPSNQTSSGPWAVEFDFDTTDGLFEINLKGTGAKLRVLVNGAAVTIGATFTTPVDGNGYLHLVNLGGAGSYRIRLEFSSAIFFAGIRTVATNGVRATPPRTLRCIVVGDSFTEPTIVDSGVAFDGGDGWPQKLGYLTGWDVWSAGRGGTGFLNPGSGVTFLNRVGDVTRNNPDIVIWAGGINDTNNGTAAQFGAQVAACLGAVRVANPGAVQIVLSPFWRSGYTTFPPNLLAFADAAKGAAVSAGAMFLDLLRLPASPIGVQGDSTAPVVGTIVSGVAANATTFVSATQYPSGTIVQVGADGNAEAKKVAGVSGSGPYTHTVSGFAQSHNAGDPVIPFGGSFITGTGRQGSPQGDGTADRYTGSDTTHPTVAGHENIARTVFALLSQQIPA